MSESLHDKRARELHSQMLPWQLAVYCAQVEHDLYHGRADDKLKIDSLERRLKDQNKLDFSYQMMRVKICEQLYKIGYMLDGDSNVVPLPKFEAPVVTEFSFEGHTELELVEMARKHASYDTIMPDGKHLRTWTGERTKEALESTAKAVIAAHALWEKNNGQV